MTLSFIRILIVDDDPDDAFVTTRFIKKGLQSSVLKIDHAASFSETLACLESSEYDLFIVDYHFNTTTEGYWAFDRNLKTLEVNASLCKMLGYSREEILAKSPDDLLEPNRRIPFQGAMGSVLAAGHKVFETALRGKEGQSVHTLFNATRILSRSGKVLQVFAFVADIRTQKEAEQALKKANTALKKIDLMKSDFVSNVSHELRTPLTSIKNAIGILVKGKAGPFNETQERFLKMAARNIDRLVELVNDVLDLSKLESGRIQNWPAELKLSTLLQNTTTLFQTQAKEKGFLFETKAMPGISRVYADPDRVEQVVCNLLSNALKFTPGGGRILLSAEQEAGWVTTSVSDTGPGLSEADQARVFDRFYQVVCLLAETPKIGALRVVERLGALLAQERILEPGSQLLEFSLPVLSPADGSTGKELIFKSDTN